SGRKPGDPNGQQRSLNAARCNPGYDASSSSPPPPSSPRKRGSGRATPATPDSRFRGNDEATPLRGSVCFIPTPEYVMRLWSLHPRYLDRQGLLALWREALLARAVLRGETRGYTLHPQ